MKKLSIFGITLSLLFGLVLSAVGLTTRAAAEDIEIIVPSNDGAELQLILDKAHVLWVLSGGDATITIRFAPNVTGTIALTDELVIGFDVTIIGPGANLLTISGDNASRVFYITPYMSSTPRNVTVTLEGLTIAGGNGVGATNTGNGGGIYNESTLIINNCIVTGNASDFNAGGISNFGGTLTLTNSTVTGNSAGANGGGIFSDNNGTVTVTDSSVSDNSAFVAGGGIYNFDGMLSLTNSTVSGNSVEAPVDGGLGGGIYNFSGTLSLTNCTVSGNSASTFAGGIVNGGIMTLTNSTVTGNRADADGDAFGSGGGIVPSGAETLNNTIVAGNFVGTGTTPNDIIITFGTIDTANNNLIGDAASAGGIANGVNGNIVGNNGVGTLDINTILNSTLADNGGPTLTHTLVPGSPALNAGSNALAVDAANQPLTTDQRGTGFPRVVNATVDIGSFESSELDTDADGISDSSDNCPSTANPGQEDADADGIGDACDACPNDVANDADGDGVCGNIDNCASLPNPDQLDTDGDGMGNVCDADDDNDGVLDGADNCPLTANFDQVDTDGDGSGNACDPDDDNDGVNDAADNCPLTANPSQTDTDGDGKGDACDAQTFTFTGFFQPVDNLPTINVATAGSAIPLKFSLGGYQGLNIFAAGYPASSQITCEATAPGDTIEETVSAGGSSLSYDATTDRYSYTWKTEKAWKGTCRILVVKLSDGTVHIAKFRFR